MWTGVYFWLVGGGPLVLYPLQYSCLKNPRDGGAWWVAVYGVAQSWIRVVREDFPEEVLPKWRCEDEQEFRSERGRA